MQPNHRKVFGILAVAVSISLGVAIAAANFGPSASASSTRPTLAQPGWRLAQPITYENLTIFPVVAAQDSDTSDFATLDEALASGDAVVTEQTNAMRRAREGAAPPNYSPGAQVNQLVFINRGKRPLLLLAGEVVSGGKQDRIIGKDRIVPVGAEPLPLDVFCVEHGRWTGASENFTAANMMVHPTVREEAAVAQDQTKVWAAVRGDTASVGTGTGSGSGNGVGNAVGGGVAAGGAGRVGSVSQTVTVQTEVAPLAAPPAISQRELSTVIASTAPTQSYQKIYKSSPVGTSVEGFAQEVQRRFDRATRDIKGEHVVGVVVAFGGETAWSDVFASSRLFNSYWPKLLRSYVVEAMTRPGTREVASLDEARDFLRPATGHVEEESEPGIYRWRKQSEGHLAEIDLDALAPRTITLHWLRVLHGN